MKTHVVQSSRVYNFYPTFFLSVWARLHVFKLKYSLILFLVILGGRWKHKHLLLSIKGILERHKRGGHFQEKKGKKDVLEHANGYDLIHI